MNSLLNINGKPWRFRLFALMVTSMSALVIVANSLAAIAGNKPQKASISTSDFQLKLSNRVYKGDPQSKFLRQACAPGRHAKTLAAKAKTSSKKPVTK